MSLSVLICKMSTVSAAALPVSWGQVKGQLRQQKGMKAKMISGCVFEFGAGHDK